MQIVVTHLTRMGGRHICLAGVDEEREHWRPILASRKSDKNWKPDRSWLRSQDGCFHLGSKVDLGKIRHEPHPPEAEDVVVDVKQAKLVEELDQESFWTILDGLAQDSLRSIFGPDLKRWRTTSAYVPVGAGERSLGILRLSGARLEERAGSAKPEIRLMFGDRDFANLDLSVTDLRLWESYNNPKPDRVKRIQGKLDDCLVAVGLAGALPFTDGIERHWLQVNNIFPRNDPLWERE